MTDTWDVEGDTCPMWDECHNVLLGTEDADIAECSEHGRWRFIAEHNSYEPLDL